MIAQLVLDASVALAWVIRATPEQVRYAEAILELVARDGTRCVVPRLWHVEIAHQLRALKESGRLTRLKQTNALSRLESLIAETHELQLGASQLIELGVRYHLSPYDAEYVFLAERDRLPIATLDGGMRTACRRRRIQLVEP